MKKKANITLIIFIEQRVDTAPYLERENPSLQGWTSIYLGIADPEHPLIVALSEAAERPYRQSYLVDQLKL